MNRDVLTAVIKAFIELGGEFPKDVSYEIEDIKDMELSGGRFDNEVESYEVSECVEISSILENEEELYFELVKQTKELPNDEIYDLIKQFFEELRGVESAK